MILSSTHPYNVTLSSDPWIPQDHVHDPMATKVKAAFHEFLREHEDVDVQNALDHAFKCIHYVPFSLFYCRLKNVISNINKMMSTKPYALLVAPNKSSQWVAELALPFLQHSPRIIADIKNFPELMRENPGIKDVLFLDDIYGMHVRLYLENKIYFMFNLIGISDFRVIVGLVYSTARDKSTLLEVMEAQASGKTFLCIGQKISTASERLLHPRYEAILSRMYMNQSKSKKIWFSIWLASGLKANDIYFNRHFAAMLKKFGMKNVHLLQVFIEKLSPYRNHSELLQEVYSNPGLRMIADLIFHEVGQFIHLFKRTQFDWLDDIDDKEDFRIKVLTYQWIILDSDDGLNSRTLTLFDHKVSDPISTLEPFSNGIIRDKNGEIQLEEMEFYGEYLTEIKTRIFFKNALRYNENKSILKIHKFAPTKFAQILQLKYIRKNRNNLQANKSY